MPDDALVRKLLVQYKRENVHVIESTFNKGGKRNGRT